MPPTKVGKYPCPHNLLLWEFIFDRRKTFAVDSYIRCDVTKSRISMGHCLLHHGETLGLSQKLKWVSRAKEFLCPPFLSTRFINFEGKPNCHTSYDTLSNYWHYRKPVCTFLYTWVWTICTSRCSLSERCRHTSFLKCSTWWETVHKWEDTPRWWCWTTAVYYIYIYIYGSFHIKCTWRIFDHLRSCWKKLC